MEITHVIKITPKHQRQINQVQTTEETQPEPPGIDNIESTKLQMSHKKMRIHRQ